MTDSAFHGATAFDEAGRLDTVRRAARGEEAAFHRLVAAYHPSMMRVAYVICGNPETALDAVQTAWTNAWQRLRTLSDPGQVGPWLIAIAANEARQSLRRQRLRPVLDISDSMGRLSARDLPDVAELLDLQRALARLKPEDRQLLALRFVAGFDATEIARHLGGSASGIRSRLARLIERLRKDLVNA